jgi:hypothetical protein
MTFEFMKNPWKYGLYWEDNALRLKSKLDYDQKGFLHLQKKSPSQRRLEKDYERDDNNFIVLRKKENKLTKKLEAKEPKKKKGKKKK